MLIKCQSYARTHLARKKLLARRALHEYSLPFIIALQSQCRGFLVRREWNQRLEEFEKLERWLKKVKIVLSYTLTKADVNLFYTLLVTKFM